MSDYPHVPWTKIGQLAHVIGDLNHKALADGTPVPAVNYRFKTKLHGTNAGIRIDGDAVQAQSRTRVLTLSDDNAGFAAWVESGRDYFAALGFTSAVIYGEWCGQGIQKSVAISQIGRKIFAVFAIRFLGEGDDDILVTDPEEIGQYLHFTSLLDIHIIPWESKMLLLRADEELPRAVFGRAVAGMVWAIDKHDAWVEKVFGVTGTGEGVVAYPSGSAATYDYVTSLMFKAKGTSHSVTRVRKVASPDLEQIATSSAFAEMFVTDARCRQALNEACSGEADVRLTGEFLKWICSDVHSESAREVEASGLPWKALVRSVVQKSKAWFASECSP